VKKLVDWWASNVPNSTEKATTSVLEFVGYKPVRGQWERQSASGIVYPVPTEMAEQRLRGARLYCAVRTAQKIQAAAGFKTMGKRAAFSVNVLGRKLDFLVVEPTTVLAGAQLVPSTAGAQAFEIPIQLGTNIIPVDGIGLPSLGEMRYGMSLVSGEAEVSTKRMDSGFVGDRYLTVTHADAVQNVGIVTGVTSKITLFTTGWFDVFMNLGLDMGAGGDTSLPDTRVFDSPPLGFPTLSRAGSLQTYGSTGYHDGPWQLRRGGGFAVLPDGLTDSRWVQPAAGPAVTKLMEDDDHTLGRRNWVALTGGVTADFGFNYGPLNVTLSAQGNLTASVSQEHVISDKLIAEQFGGGNMTAATALTVQPRTSANAKFDGVKVWFDFDLDLSLWHSHWQETIFDTGPMDIANYTSAWPEDNTMRIGTWSASGSDRTKQPSVLSHLPQTGTNFASFPVNTDACLADTTPNPSVPRPCQSKPTTGTTVQGNVCAWFGARSGTTSMCADVTAFSGPAAAFIGALIPAGPDHDARVAKIKADLTLYYSAICAPTGLVETISYTDYRTHVVSSKADLQNLMLLLQHAGADAATSIPDTPANRDALKNWLDGLVNLSACDATGHLLSTAIGPWGDPKTPPPISAGSDCH
jgi:hypothetical protein